MKPLPRGEFARIFGGVIILLCVLLGVLAVIHALALSPIWCKEADGAGWIGAIGTVGTLIGTVWLATSQERQKRIDAITVAKLHAARLQLGIADARGALGKVCRTLDQCVRGEVDGRSYAEMIKIANDLPRWDAAELAVLVPLGKGLAVKLAEASGQLEYTSKVLLLGQARHIDLLLADRVEMHAKLHELLKGTCQFLEDALAECREAVVSLHFEAASE